jgi:hypothetical protein
MLTGAAAGHEGTGRKEAATMEWAALIAWVATAGGGFVH